MAERDMPKVPAQIEPYVEVLGVDETIRFLGLFGGAPLTLSERITRRSRLVQEFGLEKAAEVARVSLERGLPARVPLQKPWRAKVLAAQGLPNVEIARRLGVSDVTVRKYLSDHKSPRDIDPSQPDLFD